jgi:uncharacterized protein (TIGR01777 family)
MARIAITGSSGFIGHALAADLRAHGHEVLRLVRGAADTADCLRWDPTSGALAAERMAGVAAVVPLAGENVAAGRWTAARRQRIRASRGPATRMLCAALAALRPPPALLSASAIGIYGDRGADELDETSAPGRGFLAEVAQEWEAGAAPLQAAGARVVQLRIGMVLGRDGGALGRMLLPFRLGLGGPLGNGRQYVSWIARRDLLAAIRFALDRADVRGPVNCTAPAPVTSREFARVLGRALRRPAVLPVPAFALRLLFGAMADELLLASQRVVPRRLLELGFRFACPDLPAALAAELACAPRPAG